MGSFTRLTYHIVFATKCRTPSITDEFSESLYEYMGGTLRAKQGSAVEIGGVTDHVHLLARLSPTFAVSNVVRDLKANSSKWVNEKTKLSGNFQWQKGYGAFTVSYDKVSAVARYIRNQQEHHRSTTFQEEYIEFLKRHEIDFQLDHLFEAEHCG